jgi:hypothetical protein
MDRGRFCLKEGDPSQQRGGKNTAFHPQHRRSQDPSFSHFTDETWTSESKGKHAEMSTEALVS